MRGLEEKVCAWLLAGDPSIRWQVMRDLLGEDENTIARERRKVAIEGWGAKLLAYQDVSGRWGGQLYVNKWLSTTYSLLLLRQMGLESSNQQAHRACKELLEGGFQQPGGISYARTVATIDNGVTGMILSLLAYFDYPDERLHIIAEYLLDQQLSDGRWEPVPGNQHLKYTFDTIFLILDGLHEYGKRFPNLSRKFTEAQSKGRDYLLGFKLYKSAQTGEEIDKKITLLSFPPRWHYDILCALDYFQDCQAARDARLTDAIHVLEKKRNPDGTWNLQNRHAGKTFFEMEQVSKPSRWNTLRALRVLNWWNAN